MFYDLFYSRQLARIENELADIKRVIVKGQKMAQADIDNLGTKVGKVETVVDSAVTLINGLAQQIRDAADDPAELKALADRLDSRADALAAKVAENTPAANT